VPPPARAQVAVDHPLLEGLVRGDVDLLGGHGFLDVPHVT
jgi:hypothetical protein